jgi:hypothetical protein
MEQLGERSFGLALFLLALLTFVPGAAMVAAVLIVWPAVQMILGHDAAVLPKFVARRKIRLDKLTRAIRFVVPKLEWVERLIRPRWATPFQLTKRFTGAVMLNAWPDYGLASTFEPTPACPCRNVAGARLSGK